MAKKNVVALDQQYGYLETFEIFKSCFINPRYAELSGLLPQCPYILRTPRRQSIHLVKSSSLLAAM